MSVPTGVAALADQDDMDLMTACSQAVETTGGTFDLRYYDDHDPMIWVAVGIWPKLTDTDSSLVPGEAAWRLLRRTVNGMPCPQCERPVLLYRDDAWAPSLLDPERTCSWEYAEGKFLRWCDR